MKVPRLMKQYEDASYWPYTLEKPFDDTSFNPFRLEGCAFYGIIIPLFLAGITLLMAGLIWILMGLGLVYP